jgi:hypothetical protein
VAEEAIACCFDLLGENLKCLLPRARLGPYVNCQPFAEGRSGFFIHDVDHCLSSLLLNLVSKAQIYYVKASACEQVMVDIAHQAVKRILV